MAACWKDEYKRKFSAGKKKGSDFMFPDLEKVIFLEYDGSFRHPPVGKKSYLVGDITKLKSLPHSQTVDSVIIQYWVIMYLKVCQQIILTGAF